MKKVLVILDGNIAKHLLKRMISLNNNLNQYDIVYMDDSIVPNTTPSNFTFYKFDPTSHSKLKFILDNALYQDALVALSTKEDTIAVISNIRSKYLDLNFSVFDQWDLDLQDKNIKYYRSNTVLSNGLVEMLPNIPVFAQNIGQRQGEIMEIKIPFGSTYAYRYIGGIGQKDWKIVALYRNEKLIPVKPSLIIKPNDIIIVIGKPDVLTQVYNAISKSSTQFPMPFGNNIYLYIDMFIQTEQEIEKALEDCKVLHQRLKNEKLIIRVTRITDVEAINKLRYILSGVSNIKIDIDYYNKGIYKLLEEDKIKYDIGVLILTQSLIKHKEAIKNIIELKLPILKIGEECISALKNTLMLLDNNRLYEQLSPALFDLSLQLKITPKIFDIDPVGDKDREQLISHLDNLSKIFNQNITLVQEKDTNPMMRLNEEHDVLQILPLKEDMFKKRYIKFLSTDSDLLSFDNNKFNQLLLPVIEEIDTQK